jgi:hypothetical protein
MRVAAKVVLAVVFFLFMVGLYIQVWTMRF